MGAKPPRSFDESSESTTGEVYFLDKILLMGAGASRLRALRFGNKNPFLRPKDLCASGTKILRSSTLPTVPLQSACICRYSSEGAYFFLMPSHFPLVANAFEMAPDGGIHSLEL
jgi:hypothetical protein